MASAIKIEVELNTTKTLYCRGCLSQGRKLKPLAGEVCKLYYSLLGSETLYGSEEHMICWECEAMLRRVRKFQNQILYAHTALLELAYNMSLKLESLSNLSITPKDYYDLHYEFIEHTHIETDYILKPIECRPEIIPDSKPTSEVPLIENSPVKIENLKLEAETSQHSEYEDTETKQHSNYDNEGTNQHSDYENDFTTDANNFEINNKPTSIDNRINEHKEKIKTKTKKKKESVKKIKEDTKAKKKRNINNSELSRHQSKKYLKHATVTDINPEFKTDVLSYFTKEILNLEQIKKYNVKLEQNPCGDRCMECRLDFRADFISILRQNLEDIKPNSTTNCLLCKRKLRSFDKLRTHWKNSHLTFCRCNLCGFYCRRDRRLNHLNDQHTKFYCCKKCDGEFTSEYHFKLHFKRLHDTFVCHHCNKVSTNRSMMIKHLAVRHKNRDRQRNIESCNICNKLYRDSRRLKYHIYYAHHPDLNKKVDKEAAYCVECDKQFKTVHKYKMHLAATATHNPVRQTYSCPVCGKIFKIKYSMENHVHQVHMQDKARFKCTICNKICCHKLSLQRHIENVHLKLPKTKDKFCDICGRGFHVTRTLVNHRRTHTGERPFKCLHCSSAFAQKNACLSHMRTQHNDTTRYTQADFQLEIAK